MPVSQTETEVRSAASIGACDAMLAGGCDSRLDPLLMVAYQAMWKSTSSSATAHLYLNEVPVVGPVPGGPSELAPSHPGDGDYQSLSSTSGGLGNVPA